jgi:hypothetical protein
METRLTPTQTPGFHEPPDEEQYLPLNGLTPVKAASSCGRKLFYFSQSTGARLRTLGNLPSSASSRHSDPSDF